MDDVTTRIKFLEDAITELKKELRRVKTAINKLEKLSLIPPSVIIVKKEKIEKTLKDYKQELKALKKVTELI